MFAVEELHKSLMYIDEMDTIVSGLEKQAKQLDEQTLSLQSAFSSILKK